MSASFSTEEAILEHLANRSKLDRAPKPDESAGWEPVRDSWVEAPLSPQAQPPRSEPPPLPPSVREPPTERSPEETALADRMLERLAAADYEASLMAAEALLRRQPRDADALDCAEISRAELRALYTARLGGDLRRVPRITSREAVAALTLDAFTAFVLSTIDGRKTLDRIAFGPNMSAEHALRVLSELYVKDAIALGGQGG